MQRQNNYLSAALAIIETMLNWKLEETSENLKPTKT